MLKLWDFESSFKPFNDLFQQFESVQVHSSIASYAMYESDTHTLFLVDLPGYQKENISISVDEGLLHVEASGKAGAPEGFKLFLKSGGGWTSYTFEVGEVRPEDIEATYIDGVLSLKIPLAARIKPIESNKVAIK